MSMTNLGIMLPSTPGFVGTFHFFCSQALQAQGATQALALSYAILVHLTFYIPATLWGAGAMLWYGVEVGATAAYAKAARVSPNVTKVSEGVTVHFIARMQAVNRHVTTSAFDRALVEALLSDFGTVKSADSRWVAEFVAGQMCALPARTRGLYLAGMLLFRSYVRVRYGRSFCDLAVIHRRTAIDSWAFGPFGPLRQLFRPVRSTFLLGYFDHLQGSTAVACELTRKVMVQSRFRRSQPAPVRGAHG
jgi:hypothetical protein